MTYLEFAQRLPIDEKQFFVENIRSAKTEGRCVLYCEVSSIIDDAFSWSGTPQGHAFWKRVHDKYARQKTILRETRILEIKHPEKHVWEIIKTSLNISPLRLACNYRLLSNSLICWRIRKTNEEDNCL